MSANAFRSQLMQQFVAAARTTNNRPTPLGALRTARTSHFHANPQDNKHNKVNVDSKTNNNNQSVSKRNNSSSPIRDSFPTPHYLGLENEASHNHHHNISSKVASMQQSQQRLYHNSNLVNSEGNENEDQIVDAFSFQTMLKTRRTTSNFIPLQDLTLNQKEQIYDAIFRAIECAIQAPNHYRTEPTTYYRIMPNTNSWEKLLDITYNVALIQYKSKSSTTEEEAKVKAVNKQMKWKNTIGGYIAVCVSGQPEQEQGGDMIDFYDVLPLRPPETERQIEDFASACASIQNILLSLHSEGLGAKVGATMTFCI